MQPSETMGIAASGIIKTVYSTTRIPLSTLFATYNTKSRKF